MDVKDNNLQELKQLVIQQKEVTRQDQEKVEEQLEEYIRFQAEQQQTQQLAKLELEKTNLHKKYH